MSNQEQSIPRREVRYIKPAAVSITQKMASQIDTAAARLSITRAEVMRRAMAKGLPSLLRSGLERQKKQAR